MLQILGILFVFYWVISVILWIKSEDLATKFFRLSNPIVILFIFFVVVYKLFSPKQQLMYKIRTLQKRMFELDDELKNATSEVEAEGIRKELETVHNEWANLLKDFSNKYES